jgi:hypothetical protein
VEADTIWGRGLATSGKLKQAERNLGVSPTGTPQPWSDSAPAQPPDARSKVHTWTHRNTQTSGTTVSRATNTLTLKGQTFSYVQNRSITFRNGARPPISAPKGARGFLHSFKYTGDVVENTPTHVRIRIRNCEFVRRAPRWANYGRVEQRDARYVGATWTLLRKGDNLVDAEDSSTVFEPSR